MRLLIATGVYPPESGGPATYTKLLEERLPREGIEVRVLPFKTVRHLPKLVRHVAYFFKCWSLARGVDIVYAQDTVSVGLPAAFASMLRGKKFVVRVPGDYAWEQARQRFGVTDELDEFQRKRYGLRVGAMRAVQRFVARRAKAIVVPSKYMQRIVSGWVGVSKVHVIYSSIEAPAPAAIERPNGFLIVTVARRVPWKGIEALEKVAAREKGWALKVCDKLPRAEALGWVKAADVFVLNSTYEGLSYALIEAMTLGTPIVATNIGGNPEVVGDAGLLIPPKDDEALYQAIKIIEHDRVGASERVARGLARAKLFSIDTAIQELIELFTSI